MAISNILKGAGQGNAAFDKLSKGLQDVSSFSSNINGPFGTRVEQARASTNRVARTPWVMSTTEWLADPNPKVLIWASNPSDVTWSMPQRSTIAKNLFGTVQHVWPDSGRGTFFDEFRLTLNLQSGSIMPIVLNQDHLSFASGESNPSEDLFRQFNAAAAKPDYKISPGLSNFYDFMQLVDAPKLTQASKGKPARANLVSIQYSSNIFPQLTLFGMFDPSGIKFTDSSQNPNQVQSWTAEFIVTDTSPRLSNNSGHFLNNKNIKDLYTSERIKKMKT